MKESSSLPSPCGTASKSMHGLRNLTTSSCHSRCCTTLPLLTSEVPARWRLGFAPVKWLAGKIASEMTYNVSSGTLNTTLFLFIHSIAFVEHIVALLPWCSSVCPSVCLGRACIVIIMVHFSADLSSLLDSPMFWAPWRQSMSTYSQPSFSSSTWNRSGVWMCKIGKALFTQILINK